MAVLKPVLKQIPGGFNVVSAIFGKLFHFPLAEPFHRLKAMGGFSRAKGFSGQVIESQPETQPLMNISQNVKSGQTLEIHFGIGTQDLVIKSDDIKPHDQIRFFDLCLVCFPKSVNRLRKIPGRDMVHAIPFLIDLPVTQAEIRGKIDYHLAGPEKLLGRGEFIEDLYTLVSPEMK